MERALVYFSARATKIALPQRLTLPYEGSYRASNLELNASMQSTSYLTQSGWQMDCE